MCSPEANFGKPPRPSNLPDPVARSAGGGTAQGATDFHLVTGYLGHPEHVGVARFCFRHRHAPWLGAIVHAGQRR